MSKKLLAYVLLDGVTSTTDGEWVDVTSWQRICIDTLGTFVGTLQLYGSCEPTKPANATDGRQIGSDFTAPQLDEITAKIKWLKMKVSAYTSGTINSHAVGDSTIYGF